MKIFKTDDICYKMADEIAAIAVTFTKDLSDK